MTVPNPPPRGGAEPRVRGHALPDFDYRDKVTKLHSQGLTAEVIAERLGRTEKGVQWMISRLGLRKNTPLQRARTECVDIRAKLEASERERCKMADTCLRAVLEAGARADAAEAALREMTEQRDGAWEAGRDAAADYVDAEGKTARENCDLAAGDTKTRWDGVAVGCHFAASGIRRLAPPAETAAKKREPEPVDSFGAHLTEPLGEINGRLIGRGHVVLSEDRYAWLRHRAGLAETAAKEERT